MSLDALLHHIYIQNKDEKTYKNFQIFIEELKMTPRTTLLKNKSDINYTLNYITWKLNINITLSVISRPKTKTAFHQNLYLFKYKFQNTIVKLLRIPNNFKPVHLIFYENKYFILPTPHIFPMLIYHHLSQNITYQSKTVTVDDVLNILNNTQTKEFPFAINIYTSYCYVQENSNQKNIIGQYIPQQKLEDIFNIFVTPALEGNCIMISHLKSVKHSEEFNRNDLFANKYKTEGTTIFNHPTSKETTLNQYHCICDHPSTQSFCPPRRYNNLGKKISYV